MTSVRPPVDPGGQITLTVRSEGGGRRVVTVGGEVDMLTSPQMRSTALDAVQHGTSAVVLDLEGITFLGTSGLAVLIELRDAARSAGVGLRLVCTSRRVVRPLMIAGLAPLFEVYGTVEKALAA